MKPLTSPRILVDLTVAPPGGASTYAQGFAGGLASASKNFGAAIIVTVERSWARDYAGLIRVLKDSGIEVVTVKVPAPGKWSARLGRGRLLRRLCEEHLIDIAFIPRDVAPRLHVPSVVLVRNRYAWTRFSSSTAVGGPLAALLLRHAARRSARRAVAVLSVSEYMAGYLPSDIRPKVVVVHHGCDLPRGEPPLALDAPPRALMVGNVSRQKGFELAMHAVSMVRSEGQDWRLDIYGGTADLAYREELDTIADSLLGTSPFRGPAFGTGLVEAYDAADVVIVGGTFESFCFPLVEAMRSGCVVVAPASPLVAEICGDVAITYEEGSASSLAGALRTALAHRTERGTQGLEQSTRFTWERSATATIGAIVAAWYKTP